MKLVRNRWFWIVGAGVLALVLVPVVFGGVFRASTARAAVQTGQVSLGDIKAQVISSAALQPSADMQLTFGVGGTLVSVNVKPGDHVTKGQTIAELDSADLNLAVVQAQANVSSAQAKLDQIKAPPAASDLSLAEANLQSAQAKLDVLKAGSTATQLSSAQSKVTQSQIGLTKAQSSATSTAQQADITLSQAQNAFLNAQDLFKAATAPFVNSNGTLKSGLAQTDIDTYNKQLRALQDAQGNLKKAQINNADSKSQQAQSIALAQAQLDDAKRQLQDLQKGPTPADLATAQAAVSASQNNLNKLKSPPTQTDLLVAQASVDQAEANLQAAKLKLRNSKLLAPISGTVANVPVIAGQTVAANTQIAEIVDNSAFHLDMNVGETDISRVKVGQGVDVTFDALSGEVYTGTVTYVAPSATSAQGVVNYLATVTLDPKAAAGSGLRPGMTASAAAIVEERDNVLMVPNRAVRSEGRQKVVYVVSGSGQVRVPVQTGISDDTSTEITGETPLREGDAVVYNTTTTTTNTRQAGGLFGGGGGGGGGIGVPRP